MYSLNSFKSNLFYINNQNFARSSLSLFRYQYRYNPVYRKYVDYLHVDPDTIDTVEKIPFLPIRFFKHHVIKTGDYGAVRIFESSGTTGVRSRHYIEDEAFYRKVSIKIFTDFFGSFENVMVAGLLPSYLERGNSSLVFMVNRFIEKSGHPYSGFFLDDYQRLINILNEMNDRHEKVILFGVTFALLELATRIRRPMKNLHIFETGGMKGRGRELIRDELHERLRNAFGTEHIYSEYGMTELISQAYMTGDGWFHTPAWMKVTIREINDPFAVERKGKTGVINIIDLANIHSCAFIATEDLGVMGEDGFKVLGRLDYADMRGCNLLLS